MIALNLHKLNNPELLTDDELGGYIAEHKKMIAGLDEDIKRLEEEKNKRV